MLKFFKKTRRKSVLENNKLKFVRYAFIEIILVVIGILIAVQINNWNENNKNRKIEIDLLEGLLEDTKTDSIFFNSRVFHLTSYINNVNNLNAIFNGTKNDSILNIPFNNYRIFDIGMAYQSTVILNNIDKIEEFTDNSVKDLLRKYILQHNYVSIAFGQKNSYFDKYAGDLLLKYSDVSFGLTNNTPLKKYYTIVEYPKNIKVVNFLKATVINSRIQTNNLLKINYELLQTVKEALKND
ncbi:DUF6090 family protein [Polaribacter uvawellassae]|uniref:DUF6090 family protein n=1 Tax=Polaribacter uvawellassae TaxID=3133495 RepID=UPI00321A5E90